MGFLNEVCRPYVTDGGRPLYCLYFDHNFWAGRLYRETIQHFDPKRHRPLRPDHLLGHQHRRRLPPPTHAGTRGWNNRKTIWEKVSQHAVNDFGDCEKIGLVQDWCVRVSKGDSNYQLRNETQITTRSD